jgi:hypothetical protein
VDSLQRPAVVDLPFDWSERRAQVRSSPAEPPPIAKLLQRKPWLLPRLFSRDVVGFP